MLFSLEKKTRERYYPNLGCAEAKADQAHRPPAPRSLIERDEALLVPLQELFIEWNEFYRKKGGAANTSCPDSRASGLLPLAQAAPAPAKAGTPPDTTRALPVNADWNQYMSPPLLTQLTVMDLVPFGNTGSQTCFYALRLTPPSWESWTPGQFVMLRPSGSGSEMLWGRPFSICRATSRDLVLFFQVRGRATTAMAKLAPGDLLDVWGPLGNSLAMEAKTPTLLLAGGIGIAPFVGYVHAHPTPWDVTMEFGHRMPLDCYPFDGINERAMADAHLEKDEKDREAFLHLVAERIQQFADKGLVLACGPTPFLEVVQSLSLKYKARTQLCLETRMACGIGACLGCVVKAVLPPDTQFLSGGPASEAPAACTEARAVQTCTCGPNFWADTVTLR